SHTQRRELNAKKLVEPRITLTNPIWLTVNLAPSSPSLFSTKGFSGCKAGSRRREHETQGASLTPKNSRPPDLNVSMSTSAEMVQLAAE
ncbi:MAG: hypothetical protein QXZ06_08530, partial [Candidatus Jordarchaeales archaeon]